MSNTTKAVRAGTKRDIAIRTIEANPTKTIGECAAIMMESGKFLNIYDARGYYNYMVKHGYVSITEVVRDVKPVRVKAPKAPKAPKPKVSRGTSTGTTTLSVDDFRAKVEAIKAKAASKAA